MFAKFLLFLLLQSMSLYLTSADSKCNAICYLDENRRLSCSTLKTLTIASLHGTPVACQRKEYSRSTEVIIGSFQDIDGINPGGLDVLRTSESKSQPYQLQLTLKLKIKVVDPGLFDKLDNLRRLQLHPYSLNPCAFYHLPQNLTQVLLQCVSPKMQMLSDMYWPANSKVEFKINMCLQKVSCYACKPTKSAPYNYSLLKSKYQGPLALNRRVSLTSCEPGHCSPEVTICLPKTTTTTTEPTTRPTTTKAKKTITRTTVRPISSKTRENEAGKETKKQTATKDVTKATPQRPRHYRPLDSDGKDSRRALVKGTSASETNTLLIYLLLGATGMNTFILLVLVCLIIYANRCCRRKQQRGVFLMSKDNYPPEYSTLRPV